MANGLLSQLTGVNQQTGGASPGPLVKPVTDPAGKVVGAGETAVQTTYDVAKFFSDPVRVAELVVGVILLGVGVNAALRGRPARVVGRGAGIYMKAEASLARKASRAQRAAESSARVNATNARADTHRARTAGVVSRTARTSAITAHHASTARINNARAAQLEAGRHSPARTGAPGKHRAGK